ncbi:sulfatase [candidate division KSB1 bacterium]|nr:sulfatase [candidate division KSB1 bacterium]NIS26388.1 sulfatase [candidate division KSB1 bacterium]NIT73147.1 sulfatase [candidate division KSB1 bacterium]NIU27074.1 sulfatase [candidate division KSB1 bacterium]NIU92928.1 sulfatase-like hydrolase/transferase [candidate division KSB1 bacterium]
MKRPNIILISIDTLRADHLSCYGYERITTPHIDRLAGEGVLFTNAYSTAVWTPPAHASMLTGLYPNAHGVIHQNRLGDDFPTVAEILQRSGYQTAGFVNNSQVGELVGLSRGHDDFYEIWRGLSKEQIVKRAIYNARRFAGYTDHGASETNKLIFHWLTKKWKRGKPFYMFIHHIDAHNPLKAPRPFRFKYLTESLRKQVDMAKIWKIADNPLVCFTDDLELNEAEIEAVTCLYDEEINYVDCKIGELVDYLAHMKLLDHSLLIVTADHGEHLGEHNLYSHVASLYEPIVHIPLILRYPRELASEAASDQPVQHIDLLPTILEVGGSDEGYKLNGAGRNLFECLNGEEASRILFAEWEGRIPYFVRNKLQGVRNHPLVERFRNQLWMARWGSFKLIADSKGHFELYNLDEDPQEQVNLYGKASTIFDQLRNALEDWRNSGASPVTSRSYDYEDETLRKHLKALGYL